MEGGSGSSGLGPLLCVSLGSVSRNEHFAAGRNLGPVVNFQGDRDERETSRRSQYTRAISRAAKQHGLGYGHLITGMRELGMLPKDHGISTHRSLADLAVNRPDEFRALAHVVRQHREGSR